MAEIVNLRRIKKLRARMGARQEAKENRVRFGRTAAERANDRRAAPRDTASLDGKRRPSPPDPGAGEADSG
jgi:hypothetical protein